MKTYESKTLLPVAQKKSEKAISRKYYLRIIIGYLHPSHVINFSPKEIKKFHESCHLCLSALLRGDFSRSQDSSLLVVSANNGP